MHKIWHDTAWEDYIYWQTQDKKTLKKINNLLKDIDRNGYQCTGKPEALAGDLSGFWSVRIDEKRQIAEKSYETGMKQRGIDRIVCYGIAFMGKNAEVSVMDSSQQA